MKKILILLMILPFCFPHPCFSQDQDEIIREEVKVTNFEVPVRVFLKGKPVDNLIRLNFKLYEDGKLQAINGFFLKRKKINIQHYDLKAKKREEIYPSRYFVLVFDLKEYNKDIEKGLDYVFDNILRKTDQLLVMVDKEMLFYNDLSTKEEIHLKIKNLLQRQGKINRMKMLKIIKRIESSVLNFRTHEAMNNKNTPGQIENVTRFLRNYYNSWIFFKKRYLTPHVDEFYYFARHLEGIKKEKWVINFYQVARYPQFRITSGKLGSLIENLDSREYHKMSLDMKAEREFPAEEVSKLFYKVNATFHSILIPTAKEIVSEDLNYKEISTALENCLREITKKTGGSLVSSADLVSALDIISEKEDVYYMLTYAPEDAEKVGKIRVEVTDEKYKYKVEYDKNIRASYIKDYIAKKEAENPEIKIKQMSFKDKKLTLIISDFLLKKEKGAGRSGQVDVHVRVEDNAGKILFDKNRKLKPGDKTTSISIDFNWLAKGEYYILTDARDELTGNSEFEFVQANVSENKTTLKKVEFADEADGYEEESIVPLTGDKELDKYLVGVAKYCERLRQGAFHFYCKEKIESIVDLSDIAFTEDGGAPGWTRLKTNTEIMTQGKKKQNNYLFDYQIFSNKGKVTEQRKLLSKKVKKGEGTGDNEEKELKGKIYSFLTERAVFGPFTLLSKERQDKFNFKLIKYEKHKKRSLVVIEATPKNKKVSFAYGKVWIDTEDYSVRKIMVDPRSISGYKKLLQIAQRLRARLFLSCEIEYNQLHRGLRFPTRVLIAETYRGGPLIVRNKGYKGWERNKTIFSYKDYKFFDVEVEVKD